MQNQQRPKRKRVAESCQSCRAKKTRCDGQRPTCSQCSGRGAGCAYDDKIVGVNLSSLSDFDARLQRLELQATVMSGAGSPHPHLPSLATTTPLAFGREDGGGQESPSSFTDDATIHFIREMMQPQPGVSGAGRQASHWTRLRRLGSDSATLLALPRRSIADGLMESFKSHVYPLWPVLHWATFKTAYDEVWAPQKPHEIDALADEVFEANLNMVLALGCLTSANDEPWSKLQTAEIFYRRTRELLPLDALDIPSMEIVQCLLLMTLYLSFTTYSDRCCNTLAVAIRVAEALQLHMEDGASPSGQLQGEMRRRVWQQCVILERIFSSVYGRATMLRSDNTQFPSRKMNDEYLDNRGSETQPTEEACIIDALFVASSTFAVLEQACRLNSHRDRHVGLPELTQAFELNDRLSQIEGSLPAHLLYDASALPRTTQERTAKLLSQAVMTRILYVRIALFRPSIMMTARYASITPVSERYRSHPVRSIQMEASSICVQAAMLAIDVLYENVSSPLRLLSSLVLYTAVSATAVIAAAAMVPESDVTFEPSSRYGNAMNKVAKILDEHRRHIGGSSGLNPIKKLLNIVEKTRQQSSTNHLGSTSFGLEIPHNSVNMEDEFWEAEFADSWNLFEEHESAMGSHLFGVAGLGATGSKELQDRRT